MFSPGGPDRGTRVLLEPVPAPPPSGDVLDLGCGYGPIALVMAARSAAAGAPGATGWAVHVNARALELCERHAATARLRHLRAVSAEEIPADAAVGAARVDPPLQ